MHHSSPMPRLLIAAAVLTVSCGEAHEGAGPRHLGLLDAQLECPACEIVVEPVLEWGDRDGPGMLEGMSMLVAMDDVGRLVVSDEPAWTKVKVYDASGAHLRTLGREGEGPGEYQGIAGLRFGPRDSLFVFDWALWRVTVYGPELEEPIRTTALPVEPLYRVLVLDDGRFVISSAMWTPELVGLPIHVIAADGELLDSFGNDGSRDPGDAAGRPRLLAPASGDGAFWAVRPDEYRLQKWTPDGTLVREIRGDEELLHDPRWEAEGFRPGPPMIGAIAEDPGGWLWVVIGSPKPNWTDYLVEGGPHGMTLEAGSRQTTIQALDPSTGEVLASTTVPYPLSAFARPGLMFQTDLSESLDPVARLFELRLEPR
jgi:hypothetical protein